MFYLDLYPNDPPGFHAISTSSQWEAWINCVLPAEISSEVKRRLRSNLKHILVGLEMKAGLILPHGKRVSGKSVLFEPYFQNLTFEFCVGVFSVCEGLGTVSHLVLSGDDGSSGARVPPSRWIPALCNAFDPREEHGLKENVDAVKKVRDKMHQDRLGLRADIDWHSFGYAAAFRPGHEAIQTLLKQCAEKVPAETNLLPD